MGRRRKPSPLCHASGVLVLDKPAGPTSHDVVDHLRRRFRPTRLGHTGTLDPFATGVLVLVFNRATKLSELLGGGRKLYRAELVMGQATDTGDSTGKVIERAPTPTLDRATVEAALAALVGSRMQSPPAYSAVKHQGRPLYSYARAGETVEKPARPITIYESRLLSLDKGRIGFEMLCSRGTYLRSLGEDLARALGGVGHLAALRRTASEPFDLSEAVSMEQALDMRVADVERRMIGVAEALTRRGLPTVVVDEHTAWRLGQGQQPPLDDFWPQGRLDDGGPFMALDPGGALIAVLDRLAPEQRSPESEYAIIRVFPDESNSSQAMTSASARKAE